MGSGSQKSSFISLREYPWVTGCTCAPCTVARGTRKGTTQASYHCFCDLHRLQHRSHVRVLRATYTSFSASSAPPETQMLCHTPRTLPIQELQALYFQCLGSSGAFAALSPNTTLLQSHQCVVSEYASIHERHHVVMSDSIGMTSFCDVRSKYTTADIRHLDINVIR